MPKKSLQRNAAIGDKPVILSHRLILDLADRLDPPIVTKEIWSQPPDIIEWGQTSFVDPITDNYVVFAEHQIRLLRAIFKLIWEGKVDTVVWSEIKKSGKTAIAGLVGAYWGSYVESPNEVITVANDQEQAQGRIYAAMVPTLRRLGWNVPERMPLMENRQNGSAIKAIGTNYAGEAGGNYGLTLWCLDEKTEILTKCGWKKHNQLTKEDEFATRSSKGYFEWQTASKINITKYSGEMYRLQHSRCDMLVTPGHNVYGRLHRSGWEDTGRPLEMMQAKDAALLYSGSIENDAKWKGKSVKWKILSERSFALEIKSGRAKQVRTKLFYPKTKIAMRDWAELCGWYIAEGCARQNSIKISQTKAVNYTKYTRIEKLLKHLKLDYRKTDCAFYIYDLRLAEEFIKLGKSHEKYIPQEIKDLCPDLLNVFFDAYVAGDGSIHGQSGRYKKRSVRFFTVSRRLFDDIIEIGLKLGYRPCERKTKLAPNKQSHDLYCGCLSVKPSAWVKKHRQWSIEQYDGIVFCPSTSNGVIYVRRNNTYYWTGNSELWAFKSEARKRLWDELTHVPTRKYSVRWVETYAGFLNESDLLWDLYCKAFKDGKEAEPLGQKIPTVEDLPIWYVPASKMAVYWSHTPRMPWLTDAFIESQRSAPGMRPTTFRRLWCNEWVSSEDIFISPEQWDALDECVALNEADGDMRPLILGADASITNDSTALVAAVWSGEFKAPEIVAAWEWRPKTVEGDDRKIVDLSKTIKAKIKYLLDNFRVEAIFYDEYQLHATMTDLKEEYDRSGVKKLFVDFPQNSGRIESDQSLYDWIVTRKLRTIRHARLREHMLNAAAKETERGFRLDKLATSQKIDLAVCASMACYGASVRNRQSRKFVKV